jgi:hypothetical protein
MDRWEPADEVGCGEEMGGGKARGDNKEGGGRTEGRRIQTRNTEPSLSTRNLATQLKIAFASSKVEVAEDTS